MIVTEVVKQVERPLLSGLIFPGYKRSKSSTSGSIFSSEVWIRTVIAETGLRKAGPSDEYPSSMGGKMSSSDADLKINFLDTPEVVKREIKKAFCEEGNVTENGLLAFTKAVLIPTSELRLERLWGNTGEDVEEGMESTGLKSRLRRTTRQKERCLRSLARRVEDRATTNLPGAGGRLRSKEDTSRRAQGERARCDNQFAGPIWAAFLANEEWEQIEQLAFLDPNAKKESKKKKEEVHHPLPPGKG